jgi:ABC-2 type transport system permease protein
LGINAIFAVMFTLYLKEIRSFLSSTIGYVAISVFLSVIGVFMWLVPNESVGTNVLEGGYANIDPLFILGHWVYLFLIPAITMRMFSEEKKTGTLELLLTRPLTEFQLVFCKYWAGVTLVFISLLPTLVYYYSVNQLGLPKGNIDVGAMWGSYTGLMALGMAFVVLGVLASSLSENQIIAFILAVLLCFFWYTGFDFLSASGVFGKYGVFIKNLSINEHYKAMSRGVVDSRDTLYFTTLIVITNAVTKLVIQSRKW